MAARLRRSGRAECIHQARQRCPVGGRRFIRGRKGSRRRHSATMRDHQSRCAATASAPPCMRQRHVSSNPACSTRPAPSRRAADGDQRSACRKAESHRCAVPRADIPASRSTAARCRTPAYRRCGFAPACAGAIARTAGASPRRRATRARHPRERNSRARADRPKRRIERDNRREMTGVDRRRRSLRDVGAGREKKPRFDAPIPALPARPQQISPPIPRAPNQDGMQRRCRRRANGRCAVPDRATSAPDGVPTRASRHAPRPPHGRVERAESVSERPHRAGDATAMRTARPVRDSRIATAAGRGRPGAAPGHARARMRHRGEPSRRPDAGGESKSTCRAAVRADSSDGSRARATI